MNREPELTNPDTNTPEPPDTAEPEIPAIEKTVFQDYYLLEGEDIDVYFNRLQKFRNSLHPRSPVEQMIVETIVHESWRMSRMVALEKAVIEMQRQEQHDPADLHAAWSTARACRFLTEKSRCLEYMGRSQTRAWQSFRSAVKLFIDVRKELTAGDPQINPTELFK